MGIEVPVRATTASLFFFAAAIAMYFSAEQPALLLLAKGSFLFFTALGPVRWIEEILLDLPFRHIPGPRTDYRQLPPELVRIGDRLPGRYIVEWLSGLARMGLLGSGVWQAHKGLWQLVETNL